ncbi:hypothetical protein [Streptomyces tendae]|uniref:hypothetical protein n=1 Tax=Streptomyces tendae TaxID=1932 RepID=UPI0037F348DA
MRSTTRTSPERSSAAEFGAPALVATALVTTPLLGPTTETAPEARSAVQAVWPLPY